MIKITQYNEATNKRIEDVFNYLFNQDLQDLHKKLLNGNFIRASVLTTIVSIDKEYEYDGFNMVIKRKFNSYGEKIDSVQVFCILYKIKNDNLKYKRLQSFSVEIMSPMKERRFKIEKLELI
jgi:hypothetical protein